MDLHPKYTFLLAQKATPFQVGIALRLYKIAIIRSFRHKNAYFCKFSEHSVHIYVIFKLDILESLALALHVKCANFK